MRAFLWQDVSLGHGAGGGHRGGRHPIMKELVMKFGKDFFKILGLIIQIMRLFASVFGDDDDVKEVAESEERSASSNPKEIC